MNDCRLSLSVEPVVPKLRVDLVDDPPRLTAGGTAVEAAFNVSRSVAGVRCYLRSQSARDYKDCESVVSAIYRAHIMVDRTQTHPP